MSNLASALGDLFRSLTPRQQLAAAGVAIIGTIGLGIHENATVYDITTPITDKRIVVKNHTGNSRSSTHYFVDTNVGECRNAFQPLVGKHWGKSTALQFKLKKGNVYDLKISGHNRGCILNEAWCATRCNVVSMIQHHGTVEEYNAQQLETVKPDQVSVNFHPPHLTVN